jgi:uncharacterized protein YqfA (UPF0365 family)
VRASKNKGIQSVLSWFTVWLLLMITLNINSSCNSKKDNEFATISSEDQTVYQPNEAKKGSWSTVFWIIGTLLIIGGATTYYLHLREIKLSKKAQKFGIDISFFGIRELIKGQFPAEKLIDLLIVCKQNNLDVTLYELEHLYLRKVDLKRFVQTLIQAKEPEYQIDIKFLKMFYLENDHVEEIIEALFELKDEEFDISLEDLAEIIIEGVDTDYLIFTLKALKNNGIELHIGEMLEEYEKSEDVVKMIMSSYKCLTSKIDIPIEELESLYFAKGDIVKTIDALIKARQAKLDITFSDLADINLSGHDVIQAVHQAINPRMIEIDNIKAVTRDRFPIVIKAKVTVRTNLKELIVGAKDETIIARIKEALTSAIGNCRSHEEVFSNPNVISQKVKEKKLDAGTALEIISVNIIDVNAGREIDAELKVIRAEYEKVIAQADSEKRKILAEISTQEARAEIKKAEARIKQAEAKLVEAEAKIREIDAKLKRESNLP